MHSETYMSVQHKSLNMFMYCKIYITWAKQVHSYSHLSIRALSVGQSRSPYEEIRCVINPGSVHAACYFSKFFLHYCSNMTDGYLTTYHRCWRSMWTTCVHVARQLETCVHFLCDAHGLFAMVTYMHSASGTRVDSQNSTVGNEQQSCD